MTKDKKAIETLSLPVTAALSEALIGTLENQIADCSAKLNDGMPAFKEQEKIFLVEKKKIDALQKTLDESKAALENVLRQLGKSSVTRVMRASSHNAHKDKRIGKPQIPWAKEFNMILRVEQRLLQVEELFNSVMKKYPNLKSTIHHNTFWQVRYALNQSIENYKNRIGEGKAIYKSETVLLKHTKDGVDYYGLREWFDDNFVLLPKYVKQFMFAPQQAAVA